VLSMSKNPEKMSLKIKNPGKWLGSTQKFL
jgi:hypothetical protein